MPSGELVAVIDVGTNSALLLVAGTDREADQHRGGLVEVEGLARTPRLGAGLARDGRVQARALERLVAVLAEFAARCDALGVAASRRRVVGTAIFRRASNADDVRAELARRTGLAIEVLSEDDEARLGYEAVAGGDEDAEKVAVVDVGGGSTELVLAGGSVRRSVPVGAVVLTERWLGLDGVPPVREPASGGGSAAGRWAALCDDAERELSAFPSGGAVSATVVALGGSGPNLACLELGLDAFDHRLAEGVRVPAAAARAWAERLVELPTAERVRLPIEAERAAILPAGIVCLALAAERLGAPELRISNRGLRHALAARMLARR